MRIPVVRDSSGEIVSLESCFSPQRGNCLEWVKASGRGGSIFTPEGRGSYILTFQGTGPDEYSLEMEVKVVKAPALEKVYFTDNPVGSKFYTPVQWLAAEGLSEGYADGTFKKERTISRGETAQLMYRMTGEPAPTEDISFPDARPVFQDAMAWFAQEGISVGYADGTFKPGRSVTRGEVATFLYRMHQPENFTAESQVPFPDVPATSAHREAIAWLAETGISTGYTDGTFRADRTLSRGEIAAFLHRYDALAQ